MVGKSQKGTREQTQLFEQAARELGCDDDPAHFDEMLKKVARHKPADDAPKSPKQGEQETPNKLG
jgi:hypothetical protein